MLLSCRQGGKCHVTPRGKNHRRQSPLLATGRLPAPKVETSKHILLAASVAGSLNFPAQVTTEHH